MPAESFLANASYEKLELLVVASSPISSKSMSKSDHVLLISERVISVTMPTKVASVTLDAARSIRNDSGGILRNFTPDLSTFLRSLTSINTTGVVPSGFITNSSAIFKSPITSTFTSDNIWSRAS